ncbi:uncharacterized protein [Anser cygnoides]|uniref:uncharacterized protein n=1 Tax=Anser cygnoides TaxID=8845 RepID=UPI0034D19C28
MDAAEVDAFRSRVGAQMTELLKGFPAKVAELEALLEDPVFAVGPEELRAPLDIPLPDPAQKKKKKEKDEEEEAGLPGPGARPGRGRTGGDAPGPGGAPGPLRRAPRRPAEEHGEAPQAPGGTQGHDFLKGAKTRSFRPKKKKKNERVPGPEPSPAPFQKMEGPFFDPFPAQKSEFLPFRAPFPRQKKMKPILFDPIPPQNNGIWGFVVPSQSPQNWNFPFLTQFLLEILQLPQSPQNGTSMSHFHPKKMGIWGFSVPFPP